MLAILGSAKEDLGKGLAPLPLSGGQLTLEGVNVFIMLTVHFLLTEELKEKLTEYVDKVNGQKPGFIKVGGAQQAGRPSSAPGPRRRAATAPVVAPLDAHVEFNVGW